MSEKNRLALYRTYRPQTFDEVREQDHIVTVLKGAIQKNAIPHALLFAGSRGTGKTTLARIFAREIGTSSLDCYEIDAASNRGIEDIRELREAVHTLPYESKQKVYIIDEVHMLTKDAFNALLKTLEEPPAHVVFILATTEEDKVLDTIRSRCQVFRFHAPSRSTLSKTVLDVAKKEKFTIDTATADLIALSAEGSFRDALSILQKVILASGDTAGSVDEVATVIGAPKTQLLRDLLCALKEGDVNAGISAIHSAKHEQVDMHLFIRLLIERLRAVILVRNVPGAVESYTEAFADADKEQILTYAKEGTTSLNSHLLKRLLDAATEMVHSPVPEISLELVVIEVGKKAE